MALAPPQPLQDAIRCIEIDPKFVKAHHRKAHALLRRGDWDEAISAAEEGLSLEPGNAEFQELIDKARRDRETDAEDKAMRCMVCARMCVGWVPA